LAALGRVTGTIAHELGHQWFYAVVGNDQARDPFLDEAMTDFLARTFIHGLRGGTTDTEMAERLAMMDRAGVDVQVLSMSSSEPYFETYSSGAITFPRDLDIFCPSTSRCAACPEAGTRASTRSAGCAASSARTSRRSSA
jgi:hypothetical protein